MAQFNQQQQGPDIRKIVDQYRKSMEGRGKWLVPVTVLIFVVLAVMWGTYSVNPGELGVVRRFGQYDSTSEPGLHFAIPFIEKVNVVDVNRVRRAEIGFRSTKDGQKRVDAEALMLTGDENIVEAQMIVQYKVADPKLYLFSLKDPESVLHVAAEVALRGVVGQSRVTSKNNDDLQTGTPPVEFVTPVPSAAQPDPVPAASGSASPDAPPGPSAVASAAVAPSAVPSVAPSASAVPVAVPPPIVAPDTTDILTNGREQAQIATKKALQGLMDLYKSGITITEVKLQEVDAPDEVKDAFHDVVRAREEREKKINKALGYRQDRIPKARGEAQKIMRAAEGYRQSRLLRAEGEASRFRSILSEYRKARGVTRQRIHLETMERILRRTQNKVVIDGDVARNALPFLPIGGGGQPVKLPGVGGAK